MCCACILELDISHDFCLLVYIEFLVLKMRGIFSSYLLKKKKEKGRARGNFRKISALSVDIIALAIVVYEPRQLYKGQ